MPEPERCALTRGRRLPLAGGRVTALLDVRDQLRVDRRQLHRVIRLRLGPLRLLVAHGAIVPRSEPNDDLDDQQAHSQQPQSEKGHVEEPSLPTDLPFHGFLANQVWLELVLAAQDVITSFQRLCLSGEARGWEPKRLRYRLLHVGARLVRSGRRWILRLPTNWPWAQLLHNAFARVRTLYALT